MEFAPLDPKKILVIDRLGALVSAFFLGAILPSFEDFFGIPRQVLYALSTLAFVFFVYTSYGARFDAKNLHRYLRVMIFANLSYCGLTIALLFVFASRLTLFGWLYFVLELAVIMILLAFETRVYAKQNPMK